MRKLKIEKKLIATFKFDKTIARRFHDIRYYTNIANSYKKYREREKIKEKYSTPKCPVVSKIFQKYKELGEHKINKANKTLKLISNKNIVRMINGKSPPVHTNLMHLLTSIPLMIQAYNKLRKNKGALTAAATIPPERWHKMNPLRKKFLEGSFKNPDGITLDTMYAASYLLKKGLYPWGASRRIYIPKPGNPNKKRPLTIPPFFDKIIQQSIKIILEAIYEPWFDKLNCSFGFRPGKGTHNAIVALTSQRTDGLHMALEGDVEAAYDRVNKNILLEILSERIKDKKFLDLIRQRLNYLYFDTESNKYESPIDGVQQGGIDSPYLYNIYMNKFDNWVVEHLKKRKIEIEQKARINRHTKNVKLSAVKSTTVVNTKEKTIIRNQIKSLKIKMHNAKTKEEKYDLIKKIRILQHKNRKMPSQDKHRSIQRFTYVRYADDWIILTNTAKSNLEQIKQEIQTWLKTNLDATLSEQKTLITDMRKTNAHYLGFELKYTDSRRLSKKFNPKAQRLVLSKTAGAKIRAYPDKNRLINRFYMKGYCDMKGKPITIPWLSCMEPYMIIDKYNAVISGFANYYTEFVYNKRSINRWIYILRYSCIKTLAQKYKTTTRKIFAKYNVQDQKYRHRYGKTIEFKVRIKYKDDQLYEKPYRLMTYLEAIQRAVNTKIKPKLVLIDKTLQNEQNYITYQRYVDLYKEGNNFPKPIDGNYLEKIKWINWRTSCSFNMPCCICGALGNTEMHHVKHVRKNRYSMENQPTWDKLMGLRNRKQIPVCRKCHMNLIHSGTYNNISLKLMANRPLVDNRIITVENYINSGPENTNYTKTLYERGFRKV